MQNIWNHYMNIQKLDICKIYNYRKGNSNRYNIKIK